jgi:hypothetical protein
MLKEAWVIFNSIVVSIIISLIIHETIHYLDMKDKYRINEICYLGISFERNFSGGWVEYYGDADEGYLEMRAMIVDTIIITIFTFVYVFFSLYILDA